jgi:AbrB family looped-hinge helix DNA binding protein
MPNPHKKCYGSVTVGERGQVVIPAEAREELTIEAGDKLLVFQVGPSGIIMIKAESVSDFVSEMMEKLARFKEMSGEK